MSGGMRRSVVLPFRKPRMLAVLLFAAVWLAVAASPAYATVTSVSGGAFGESVNVTPLGLLNISSGPTPSVTLPANGTPQSASLASICAPGPSPVCTLLSTGILSVSSQGTLGASGGSTSSASVANVSALGSLPGVPVLTATVVKSQCTVGPNSSSGSTTLAGATLGTIALALNPAPNTTILNIPGVVKVILNEQIPSGGPGNYSLTVNAIHVILGPTLGNGDIIISSSTCGEQGPDVTIPFAPIGILGVSAIVGAVLVRSQWRRRDSDSPAITG
jgi:hypothetical protein